MVQIVDYKTYEKDNGETFHALVVQGGVEAVVSKETGKTYLTARTASVSCTFNKFMCESLLGTQLEGSIRKVHVDPYDYNIPGSDVSIELSHRYEFISNDEKIIDENLIEEELVM